MNDAERNELISELAVGFFALEFPNATRQLHDMDERTIKKNYQRAGFALKLCEERLLSISVNTSAGGSDEEKSPFDESNLKVADVLAPDNPEIDECIPF